MTSDGDPDFREGMPFLGGALWLDLLNSAFELDGVAHDFLADDESFARWVAAAGLALAGGATLSEERDAALALRARLTEIHETIAAGEAVTDAQTAALNGLLAMRRSGWALRASGDALTLDRPEHVAGVGVASAIALDCARFLVSYAEERLKRCANPNCSMVFYDQGKNNRRRWCTMAICGNRAKVSAYRARKTGV